MYSKENTKAFSELLDKYSPRKIEPPRDNVRAKVEKLKEQQQRRKAYKELFFVKIPSVQTYARHNSKYYTDLSKSPSIFGSDIIQQIQQFVRLIQKFRPRVRRTHA